MKEILAELSKHPVSTPLLLTGTLVVARDIAHAKFKELIDAGKGVPDYLKNHPVYYAGPAKTPKGKPSGSFGPTTAGRMDSYVDLLQSHGGSLVMIAKGNRSQQVTDACKKYGGFYLGSIGGPAAVLAKENIKKVECSTSPSSAWRRSGRSRSWTSRPSSSSTTRATTSSRCSGSSRHRPRGPARPRAPGAVPRPGRSHRVYCRPFSRTAEIPMTEPRTLLQKIWDAHVVARRRAPPPSSTSTATWSTR